MKLTKVVSTLAVSLVAVVGVFALATEQASAKKIFNIQDHPQTNQKTSKAFKQKLQIGAILVVAGATGAFLAVMSSKNNFAAVSGPNVTDPKPPCCKRPDPNLIFPGPPVSLPAPDPNVTDPYILPYPAVVDVYPTTLPNPNVANPRLWGSQPNPLTTDPRPMLPDPNVTDPRP